MSLLHIPARRIFQISLLRALAALVWVLFCLPAEAVDTTWTFNGDGNWTEAAKWSNGEPNNSAFNVFVDDGDTAVTVTLNQSRTIGSLTLGTDDTLSIFIGSSVTQTLTSANGFTNDGSILLSGNNSGAVALVVTTGALINSASGLLYFQTGGTGARFFTGDLTNNGTVTVDRGTTFNKSGGSYTNNNQLTVAAIGSLIVSNAGVLTQAAGTLDLNNMLTLSGGSALNLNGGVMNMAGNVTLSGTGSTFSQNGGTLNYTSGSISGGTYRYLGGTITGTLLFGSNATLEIGPAATNPASFLFSNNSTVNDTLVGDVHAGQTLTVQPPTSGTHTLTSATGFANDGSIVLTGTSSGTAAVAVTSGALTNSATGLLHFDVGGTGSRTFTGDLVNNGTVTVDRTTSFNKSGGQYTNNNQFTVGSSLNITSGGTFNQAAGTLDVNSTLILSGSGTVLNLNGGALNMNADLNLSGNVFAQNGGTLNYTSGSISGGLFRYLGGTITGTLLFGSSSGTLEIGPAATNPASFLISNNSTVNDTLVGDVHAGQTLTVQPPTSGVHTLTSATGFTNDGSIVLTGTSSGTAALAVTSGALTNSATGLLDFDVGGTGIRTFTSDLTNNGTVTVDRTTSFNKSGGQYTNNNQFIINSSLTINNGGTLTQVVDTLDLNDTLTLSGGSALSLNGGTLNMAGNVNASGTGNAFTQNGGTLNYTSGTISGAYNYLGGTITGTPVLTNATLTIGPAATNPASFLFSNINGSSTLAGDVHAGQTLTMKSNGIVNFTVTSANGFTNDGSILLTGTNSGGAVLTLTTGALTNGTTGLLHFQTGGTGSRTFTGDLVNNGTVTVDRNTTFNKLGGQYANSGQFTVGSGATLTITGGTLTNFSANTLTGGKYDITGTLRFPGADIVTNQAEIILRGASSQILNDTGSTIALANLAAIGSSGVLRLFSSRNFTAAGAFTSNGTLELGGTTFSAPSLAISASGLAFGTGTLTSALTNNGTVRATGGTLTVSGALITNNGTFEALNGSALNVTTTPTNLSAGTLVGGTYRVVDGGSGATLTAPGTAVATLAAGATAELSGPNSTLTFGGANLAASLTNNAGTIRIYNGRSFAMTSGLTNTGNFELGGSGLADSTLTSGGNITNTSSGTIFGHGIITSGLDNSGILQATGGTLSVQASVRTSNGTFAADDGAMLVISGAISDGASGNSATKAGAGIATFSGINTYTGATNINAGTLRANGGSAIPDASQVNLANVAGVSLDLNGSNETIGNLSGGGMAGGNVALGSGGALSVNESGATNFSGAISGTGSVTKLGAGTLNVYGGNTIFGSIFVAKGVLAVTGGNTSTGALHIDQSDTTGMPSTFVVNGGSFTASENSTVSGVHATSSAGPGQFLLQTGSAAFNGGLATSRDFGPATGLVRIEGGTFTASDVSLGRNSGNSVDFNSGWVITGGSATVGTFELGTTNSNGTLSVEGGTLMATGPVTIARQSSPGRGGAMRVMGGTFVSTDATDGIILSRQDEGGNADQIATASFSGGTSTVEKFKLGYDANVNAGSAAMMVDGGTLYIGSGGVEVNGSGTFAATMNLSGGTLGAHANWSGTANITLPTGGNINIKAADAANLPHDITLSGSVSGAGSLTKSGGGTLTLTGSNTYAGTTTVQAGAMVVSGIHSGGGEYTIDAGARLAGNGVIDSSVHSSGSIAPGSSPAMLTIGALQMDATAALQIELGGTTAGSGYDRLVVQGAATLNGALDVSLVNGFVPAAGDAFDIFDWGTLSGTFAAVALPELPADLRWNDSRLYNTGELIVRWAGDFNGDGAVDATDYVAWRKGLGTAYTQTDYAVWRDQFGHTAGSGAALAPAEPVMAVLEPATLWLSIFAASLCAQCNPRMARESRFSGLPGVPP